jgi:hypothetical protein
MTFDTSLAGFHSGCGGKIIMVNQPNGLLTTMKCSKCTSTSSNGTLTGGDICASPYDAGVTDIIAADLAAELAFLQTYIEE